VYSYWISLVVISLGISLVAFVWALRSGQFSEQGRARYLPLSDTLLSQPMELERASRLSKDAYVLLAIVILGALGIGGSLVLSLWHFRG
jgi:cbb3-type cytochrome oxidase maturation protein